MTSFSAEDVTRLLEIATAMAERTGTDASAAVKLLGEMVDSKCPEVPVRRSPYDAAALMRQLRVRRNDMLNVRLFRDPAWDMALDLLVAHRDRREVSVGSLSLAAGVPATTGLRHIERMEAQGVIERVADEDDCRRSLIRLTPHLIPLLVGVIEKMQASV